MMKTEIDSLRRVVSGLGLLWLLLMLPFGAHAQSTATVRIGSLGLSGPLLP
jgi:hypothetical protein